MTVDATDFPDPLPTSVVNCAIRLFSQTLALQSPSIQQGALEQISTILAAVRQQNNPAKEQALMVNIIVALLLAVHYASDYTKGNAPFSSPDVQKAIQELLNVSPLSRSLSKFECSFGIGWNYKSRSNHSFTCCRGCWQTL